jgi:hypothetical protein
MPAKKSASKKSKKKTSKRASARKTAPKTAPTVTVTERIVIEKPVEHEPTEEHRVFSHVMYILFLIAAALAAYYTFSMWMSTQIFRPGDAFDLSSDRYLPVKALVMIGWAFLFKTFAHRVHIPRH